MTMVADGQPKYVRMSVEGECGVPRPFRDGERGDRTALRYSAVDSRGVTLVGIDALSMGRCGGDPTEDIYRWVLSAFYGSERVRRAGF